MRTTIRPESGLVAFFVFALVLFSACGKEISQPAPERNPTPNVLIITVDTLRPDALGWVSGRNATPAIDRVASEGFRFPSAVAPVPLTFPSHAAIFTGFLPRRLGLRDNGQMLGAKPETLAEILKRSGYATAAFVSGYPLASEFGLDRGFDHYDDRLTGKSGEDLERRASATTESAIAWLRGARPPWFVWIHYYDPHFPYEPPSELLGPGARGSYDGEVAFVDRAIGELRSALGTTTGDLLTVFAGDHGESLGEHGEGTHGFFIYDSTVLVPLLFHFPGRIVTGESRAPARLTDVAPTILDLLGLPPLREADGVSLAPMLAGKKQEIPAAYVETYQPWTSYGWSPLHAVRHEEWKFIAAPRPELYRLDADPGEHRNLFGTAVEKERELQVLRRRIEARPEVSSADSVTDPEALARLRSLGYLGAGRSSAEPSGAGLRDPKDGALLRALITKGDVALRDGNPRAALASFEVVLKEEPENRFALLRSAAALLALGRAEAALPRLEKATRLDPALADARSLFADALLKARRPQRAAEQAMELARLQPRNAEAWAKLGTALGLSGKPEEAARALTRSVELDPENSGFLARLAFAQHAAGQISLAAASLQRLAKLTGDERFPHAGALGILLVQLGQKEKARGWLAKSRPREGDFPNARWELAILELDRGRIDEARQALREALSAAPDLREKAAAHPRLAPLLH